MRKQFYQYINKLFVEDDKIVVLLGDIGVFSMQPAFKHDPKRVYNIGILEQATIGVAAGLSSCGFVPIVHSIAPFITERCFEQLKLASHDARNMFIISVGNSYDYAALGPTHHCPGDLLALEAIPDLMTFCPGGISDVQAIFRKYRTTPRVKYIRLAEESNNIDSLRPLHTDLCVLQEGRNGIVIVMGTAIKDLTKLASLDVTVLYSYCVSDFDVDALSSVLDSDHIRKVITVIEPGYRTGLITRICCAVPNIESVRSVAVPHTFIDKYGTKKQIDSHLGLDDHNIVKQLGYIYG